MKYATVCSGIGAPETAWEPLGWESVFASEIEAFPSAVLAHRHPGTVNLGDMNNYRKWKRYGIDLLCGGTPCQAFSVAGLRAGLADPRGNLTLTYLGVIAKQRPRWVVWENVPGVLSDKTGAFGAFLSGLAELGYGFAYRILDAQYAGVPQRRRRVFVVAHLGSWQRAAAVLFERHSLQGHPAPGREARKDIAPSLSRSAGSSGHNDFNTSGGVIPVAPTLSARQKGGGGLGTDFDLDGGLVSHSLRAQPQSAHDPTLETYITHTLKAEHDASEDGTGRGVPLIAATLDASYGEKQGLDNQHIDGGAGLFVIKPIFATSGQSNAAFAEDAALALNHTNEPPYVATGFQWSQGGDTQLGATKDGCPPVRTGNAPAVAIQGVIGRGDKNGPAGSGFNEDGQSFTLTKQDRHGVATASAVRRLTPRECERLQGFPDDYTLIPWRKRSAEQCPDGPRYKALGNSMAVPVMLWIGRRIQMVDTLCPL